MIQDTGGLIAEMGTEQTNLSIDEDVKRRAQIKARLFDKDLSEVVEQFLDEWSCELSEEKKRELQELGVDIHIQS